MTLRPQAIGRYQVQRVLGQGAMGTVYLAMDPRLMRPVAVKVLRDPGQDQSQILARFQREAVVSAKLNHPHVITIFDVGEDPENGPFMAMEYVDGVTLASLIHEGLAPEQSLRLLAQTMSALVAAEEAGVAHRDVKPENILVSKDWRVKLMDFGIARSDGVRITQGGRLFGTPFYTAPEVLAGGEASCITDRYSFAVTAFEALCGALPFQGASIGAVVYAIVHESPLFPESMEPSLRFVFEQALAKEPEARFPDLFSFMDALIETVALPEESRSRLRHYVSEIRAHTQAPPMGVTQSLEDRKDIHNRPTAPPDKSSSLKETLELSPLDDDIFDGPSWQTVVIPASSIPTFASPAGEPRKESIRAEPAYRVERPPTATPAPIPQAPPPPAKAATHPVPVLRPDPTFFEEGRKSPEPGIPNQLESPNIGATRPMPVVITPPSAPPSPRLQQPVIPRAPSRKKSPRFLYLGGGGLLALGLLAIAATLTRNRPEPAPAPIALVLTSEPEGAAVYIDDQPAGTTPLEQIQTPGPHTVRMELPGYSPLTRTVPPEQKKLHLRLQAYDFAIAVASDPPGADVFLNDSFMGTTPLPSLPVPKEGRRELALRLPGYSEWRAEVDPDLPFPERITLNPIPGRRRKR